MPILAKIMTAAVAVLHFYFLVLEMFLWTKPYGRRVFRMDEAKAETTKVLAANQGLYNGFLAMGLVWALLYPSDFFGRQIALYFLACVIVAAVYGGYSVGRKILFIQGLPALVALIATYLAVP